MSRSVRTFQRLALLVIAILAFCSGPAEAKSVISARTEMENLLPLACPDDCGSWCDNCTFSRTVLVNATDEDEVFLPDDMNKPIPLPSGLTDDPEDDPADDPPGDNLIVRDLGNLTLIVLAGRQANSDIVKPKLTTAESWSRGKKDWWTKIAAHTISQGQVFDYFSKSTAYVHHFDADSHGTPLKNPDPSAGGFPPVRGCTIFVGVSDLGIVAAHFWENPTFVAVKYTPAGRAYDTETRDAAYLQEVTKFLIEGNQFYTANPAFPQHQAAPDSPVIADLVKPGMILDPVTTAWRQFRLFMPYAPSGPPGRNPKNAAMMSTFRLELAGALGVQEDTIVLHSPYYEPHDMGPEYKANVHGFNTLTWQYAPAQPVNNKNKRALRVTFDGAEVADMTLKWKPNKIDMSKICRIEVRLWAYATLPNWNHLHVSYEVFDYKSRSLFSEGNHKYELGRTPGDQLWISKDETKLDTPISLWFTEDSGDPWPIHPQKRPGYDNWHINADFGNGQMYTYKGDATVRGRDQMPACRGGSWRKSEERAIWERTSSCLFRCKKA